MRSMGLREELRSFRAVPRRFLAVLALVVLAALSVPYALGAGPTGRELALAVLLVGFAGLSAELGRAAEGGAPVRGHRPHKALSAWAFAAALLLPVSVLPLLVALAYGWTWVRGLRTPLPTWCASAATVVLAATAAGQWPAAPMSMSMAMPTPLPVLLAAGTYLAVESLLLAAFALVDSDTWLRRQLRGASFYRTELAVLAGGAVVAILWTAAPVFILLVAPMLGVLQRAVLVQSLRDRALRDDKTGLLQYNAWRDLAERDLARHDGAVLFADLDRFKAVNDTFGHLVGDEVLAEVARRLAGVLRARDLAGRFGGEEFCLLLPQADAALARRVADRLRDSVRGMRVHDVRITLSIGVAVSPAGHPQPLEALMAAADQALYRAKQAGRDRSELEVARPGSIVLP